MPRASDPHRFCTDCRHLIANGMRCSRRPGQPKANMVRINPNLCGPEAKLFEAKAS